MKFEEMNTKALLDTKHTIAERLFDGVTYPWEALAKLGEFIETLGPLLPEEEYTKVGKNMWIHNSARIAPTAALGGPFIICRGAQIRHSAFLRGRVIVGENAVVGNSCEVKNSVLFDGAAVPHFNYVGDSILGYGAHMGAGAITSNVKSDKSLIVVHGEEGGLETGLKKFGAILGDGAEIGCNSVLNPGCVVGREATVYPLSSVRGCVDAHSIYKAAGNIVAKEVREVPAKEEEQKATPGVEAAAEKAEGGDGSPVKVVK